MTYLIMYLHKHKANQIIKPNSKIGFEMIYY